MSRIVGRSRDAVARESNEQEIKHAKQPLVMISRTDNRVLHVVSTERMRGAERFACELASSLSERGVEQKTIALSSLRAMSNSRALFAHLHMFRALRNEILGYGPSAILCHGTRAMKFVRIASLNLRLRKHPSPRIILIKIGMTSPWLKRFRRVRLAIDRLFLQKVDRVVALGPAQIRELQSQLGVPAEKIELIPNGRIGPSASIQRPRRRDNQILFVGAIEPEKNPDMAIRLIRDLRDRGRDAVLMVLGVGSQTDNCRKLAKELKVENFVQFCGHVPDVWSSMYESSLLLICSETEGVPGVVIESLFAGLPVVGWEVGDLSAVVVHGVTGVVVPFHDYERLVVEVDRLLGDVARRRKLSDNCSAAAAAYSMEAIATRYEELIFGREDFS